MTQFSLAPAFVKLRITYSTLREHVMTIPVRPSGVPVVGELPNVLLADDSIELFTVAIDDFVDALKPLFGDATSFGLAEFWYQPTAEDDPVWIYTYDTSETGTNASPSVALLMATCTFRTKGGHVAKIVLMEPQGTANYKDVTPWSGAYATMAAFMMGDDCLMVGRDGTRLMTTINVTTKYSDALRKRYFLSD
jgi:hypothetical protein